MHGNTKHGDSKDERLYRIWGNMKTRCYNPNHERYSCYGGRGIEICAEWKDDYVSFKKWALSNGYQDDLTIDRIDSFENYCPENCRWITRSYNSKRVNGNDIKYVAVDKNGMVYYLTEYNTFCKEHGLNKGNVSSMINGKNHVKSVKGWTIRKI